MLFAFPRLESYKAALFALHRSRLLIWAASKGATAAAAAYNEGDDEAKAYARRGARQRQPLEPRRALAPRHLEN